jgi:hypothetical protein
MRLNAVDKAYALAKAYVQDLREIEILPDAILSNLEGWVRSRAYQKLAGATSLTAHPDYQGGKEALRHLMQVEGLFKKNPAFADERTTTLKAVENFHEAEKLCRITNRRLRWYYSHPERLAPDLAFYLRRMENDISNLLGDPAEFFAEIPSLVRVTSGASVGANRKQSRPDLKVRKTGMTCTPLAAPLVQCLAHHWGFGNLRLDLRDANRIEFVLKDWRRKRVIAAEPVATLPLQLCFDAHVKDRLCRLTPIRLNDQSHNQRKAYIGSIDGSFATVDARMASDTSATEMAAWMLPPKWFAFLSALRAPKGIYKGDKDLGIPGFTVRYAKFSSMGNGATFALETLVFTAACRALGSKGYQVYGDDIVIETELVAPLTRLLRFLGFYLNPEKSFSEGPFRESCGSNWYEGSDITPFKLDTNASKKTDLSLVVNQLGRRAVPGGHLWKVLQEIVQSADLPLVPWESDDDTCGVHLDVPSCYALGVLKTRSGALQVKKLVVSERKPDKQSPTVRPRKTHGGLLLWHLKRYYERERPVSAYGRSSDMKLYARSVKNVDGSTGRVSTELGLRVRAKWTYWAPCAPTLEKPLPTHIHLWSEDLVSLLLQR